MSRTDETKALTETAFWSLLNAGHQPSVDLVNGWLEEHGYEKRNRNTISNALKGCWEILGRRVKNMHELPGIPRETVQLVLQLRDAMMVDARALFDAEREQILGDAEARVQRALGEVELARTHTEAALLSKRESDAALLAHQEEHQRVVGELASVREGLERAQRAIAARDVELGQAREALVHEKAAREADRAGAQADIRRLTLEVDQLRTQLKSQQADATTNHERLQKKLDASADRERGMQQENATLKAEIGALRGAERVLKDRTAELVAELAASREQTQENASRLAVANDRTNVLSSQLDQAHLQLIQKDAQLAARPDMTEEDLFTALATAYADGVRSAGKPAKQKETEEDVFARAKTYARRLTRARSR